ncbi:MAG: hypothetical protein ACD_75C00455G0005 [uncultured bacterium]|nr:MAG: hypothetical protein ACD_75C00455G0005 [uncultured bacterium]
MLFAPRALHKPISAVRWVTDISITFIIRIPATARLIEAIPVTIRVRTLKIRLKVESTESWVMMVTSSSP